MTTMVRSLRDNYRYSVQTKWGSMTLGRLRDAIDISAGDFIEVRDRNLNILARSYYRNTETGRWHKLKTSNG